MYDEIFKFKETYIAKINNSLSMIEKNDYGYRIIIHPSYKKISCVDYDKLNIIYRFEQPITAAIIYGKYANHYYLYDTYGNVLFVNYKPEPYTDCVIKYVITQMRIEKLKLLI